MAESLRMIVAKMVGYIADMAQFMAIEKLNESGVGKATDYKSVEKVADVAQLAEQLICNQQVIGSSPIIGFSIVSNLKRFGPLAQLVRAPPCHGGGRGFESHSGRLAII